MISVLIVDDEFWVRENLKIAFDWQEHGFSIVGEAANAHSAYELFLQLQPDVVIADIRMNTTNGLDLLESIHNISPETILIVISGYEEFDYARRAIASGVLAYLVKPIDDDDLREALLTAKARIRKKVPVEKIPEIPDDPPFQIGEPSRLDIKVATEYIQAHYAEPLTVSIVASHIGLTEAHFSRLFKQEVGITFLEYLTRYRIYVASCLLKRGNCRVNEAAALVGYSKPEYFSEIFKKIMGCTPKRYIMNQGGGIV